MTSNLLLPMFSEAAFKAINAFLCDVIEHAPPEMKEFLERQRFSEWKLRKMVERLGGEKLEHHHQFQFRYRPAAQNGGGDEIVEERISYAPNAVVSAHFRIV